MTQEVRAVVWQSEGQSSHPGHVEVSLSKTPNPQLTSRAGWYLAWQVAINSCKYLKYPLPHNVIANLYSMHLKLNNIKKLSLLLNLLKKMGRLQFANKCLKTVLEKGIMDR